MFSIRQTAYLTKNKLYLHCFFICSVVQKLLFIFNFLLLVFSSKYDLQRANVHIIYKIILGQDTNIYISISTNVILNPVLLASPVGAFSAHVN